MELIRVVLRRPPQAPHAVCFRRAEGELLQGTALPLMNHRRWEKTPSFSLLHGAQVRSFGTTSLPAMSLTRCW